jgi:hypothetical protein
MKLPFTLSLLALALAPCYAAVEEPQALYRSQTDGIGPSQYDFGGVGLLQMPTARMARVGEFSSNYMDNEQYRRWSISVQPYEWLETTLRYTDIRTRLYSDDPNFSGDQTYKDKGMDIKLRLLNESYWLPQTAIGIRDFTGTGLFDSEYLVTSKRWGNLDFTLGMGWGNMAESGNIQNPFCSASETWCERSGGFSGSGGKFEFNNLFHGPTALFGGVEYQTPWQPLRLKLEYDGNDYSQEAAGVIQQDSPINVGAVYRVTEMLDSHLSYQRGNTLMWGFTLRTNFNDMISHHLDEPRPAVKAQQASAVGVEPDWQQIARDLERNAGWSNPAIYHDQHTVTVVAEQKKYRNTQEANTRASVIVANAVPDATELTITARRQQMPVDETTVDLTQLRHQQTAAVLGEPAVEPVKATTPTLPRGVQVRDGARQRLDYSWSPHLAQSFGGAESFYMYQIGINGNADLALTDKLWASGTLYLNLTDNYDKFNYTTPPSDTEALPRVRTWIREYVSSSNVLLNNLQLTAMDKLATDWYAQAYGGYLEMMYAGVGSEVLYRPYGQSWALGLDGNYVQQRDWENTLKLADYKVATGHLTAYWELPYIDDTLAQISIGRYLAKDIGTTINLSRKFDSGVVAGVFATFTDVSAEEYGEGSFNKGVYFTIPFDFLQVRPTVRQGTISWIPLTRDGGQMLSRKYGLYTISKTAE